MHQRSMYEERDVGGERKTALREKHSPRYLFDIEEFVTAVGQCDELAFVDVPTRHPGVSRVEERKLGRKYYRKVNKWIELYNDRYHYSPKVEVFHDICKEFGLISQGRCFRNPKSWANSDGTRYMDLFNTLIERIRTRCRSRKFKEAERLSRLNTKRNVKRLMELEGRMFSDGGHESEGRSRWLVLWLTLGYEKRYRGSITPEVIKEHRDKLLASRRLTGPMRRVKNYVWTIEEGDDVGLHMHVVIFYASDRNHDEYYARQIGEYWVNSVTRGIGDYWNGNTPERKRHYRTKGFGVGVGQINSGDAEMRTSLRKVLEYMAKADQYLRSKGLQRMRTIGWGKVPKKIKAGRKRAERGWVAPRRILGGPYS
ncbi:inovirus Gp2 family protein [Pandoraea pnomenusa]|nr:inovirus Gp2 family protein [Pandoraea pnomenusa]